jgi:hypothetical protein
MKLAFPIVISVVLSVCSSAEAAPLTLSLYGLAGFVQACASGTVAGMNYFGCGVNDQFQTSVPYTKDGSVAIGAASGTASVSATINNGNVGLHGFSQSDVSVNADAKNAYAEGGFDLYAYDMFTITGTPGTRAQFQFILTLRGSASELSSTLGANGSTGELGLFVNSSWSGPGTVIFNASCADGGSNAFGQGSADSSGNPCGGLLGAIQLGNTGVYPTSGTNSATLSLAVGSTVEIGEYLYGRTGAYGSSYGGAEPSEGVFDVADTGWFTVTPLTPGAGFITASGLDYSDSPEAAMPEPSGVTLLCAGLFALAALRRLKGRFG